MRMDITSDVTCPWCFSGKHRRERTLALRPDLAATRAMDEEKDRQPLGSLT